MWSGWKCIKLTPKDLSLNITLDCGQAFRWRKFGEIWTGFIGGTIWKLKQDKSNLWYNCYEQALSTKEDKKFKNLKQKQILNLDDQIYDYFNLQIDLTELYDIWRGKDEHIREVATNLPGIRLLRQDPVENLFSFICSSNNNIKRIGNMVESLCTTFGELILTEDDRDYYSFPTVEQLSQPSVIGILQGLGFGYRAKFIQKSAELIHNKPEGVEWLFNLRNLDYLEAKAQLRTLHGVGAKVADCVCLFSLDHTEAIPVDTHVWQIARKFYLPSLKDNKSLTDNIYHQIGDCFRDLYGNHSGWAHCVLFCGDLKKFIKEKEPKKRTSKAKLQNVKKQKC